ncbi:MAG TPA: hypothetical protein VIL35_13425 [Vicinamibacterales bacterium]
MIHTQHLLDHLLAPAAAVPGTLWTLTHETEGRVSVNIGPHPHGYELRIILNQRFLRSRVHRSLPDVLADAADTRVRFERLGFAEAAEEVVLH